MSDTVDIEIDDEGAATTDDVESEETMESSDVDPGVVADREEEETFERERAVPFDEVTTTLAETFDIDARSGETITDLSTVESDDGRQLVATVDRSRRTAFAARLASARRTGRRIGTVALVLGVVGLALSAFRRARGGGDEEEELTVDVDPDDDV